MNQETFGAEGYNYRSFSDKRGRGRGRGRGELFLVLLRTALCLLTLSAHFFLAFNYQPLVLGSPRPWRL